MTDRSKEALHNAIDELARDFRVRDQANQAATRIMLRSVLERYAAALQFPAPASASSVPEWIQTVHDLADSALRTRSRDISDGNYIHDSLR